MKRSLLLISIAAAGVLLLSGCFPGSTTAPPADTGQEETVQTDTPGSAEVADQPTAAPSEPTREPTRTSPPDDGQGEEEDAVPTPRVGLQATDPETVSLGSGDIQLVEFFAFW